MKYFSGFLVAIFMLVCALQRALIWRLFLTSVKECWPCSSVHKTQFVDLSCSGRPRVQRTHTFLELSLGGKCSKTLGLCPRLQFSGKSKTNSGWPCISEHNTQFVDLSCSGRPSNPFTPFLDCPLEKIIINNRLNMPMAELFIFSGY